MIALAPGLRVYLACGVTDMRKYAGRIVMRSWLGPCQDSCDFSVI
jgi:hypothetical protein